MCAHIEDQAILGVFQRDRVRGPPLHVKIGGLIDVINLSRKRGFAAKGQIHQLVQDRQVSCGQGIGTRPEQVECLAALHEKCFLPGADDQLRAEDKLLGRIFMNKPLQSVCAAIIFDTVNYGHRSSPFLYCLLLIRFFNSLMNT